MGAVPRRAARGSAPLHGLLAALCAAWASAPAPDVDVGVPPGSPLDWSRAFPALTPGSRPLFQRTTAGGPAEEAAEPETSVPPEHPPLDVRFSSSFDLTRILTHDIVDELGWIETQPRREPVTGRWSSLPPEPEPGDPLYWTSLAALLRLLLHPSETPRSEVEVHLIEIGEPVLPVLESARGQKYLRATCEQVAERVTPKSDGAPEPLVPAAEDTPRERMLLRFVFDELCAAHPCDPVGSFGSRLFLFGEELEPYVARYATHANAHLRRAAVAALGRYRTRTAGQALVGVAVTSDDPVAVARALAGLGRTAWVLDASPLAVRLEGTGDLHERTALIGALARLGASRAVPAIARIGREALERSESDLLVTVLGALARIPARGHADLVRELCDDVLQACRNRPLELGPSGGPAPIPADRPDGPRLRSVVLQELASIARARLDPLEPEVQRELLGLLSAEPPPATPDSAWLDALSLERIQPPARFAMLDLLESMERAGVEPLLRVAADAGEDPALRAHAIACLPRDPRIAETGRLAAEGTPLLRIHALHLAERDAHPELEALARAALATGAAWPAGGGSSAERHLALVGLRALDARGLLSAADLLPLLFHARAPQHASGDWPERVRAAVAAWIARVAARVSTASVEHEVRSLVDLAVARGLRPELAGREHELAGEIAARLDDAAAHASDAIYLELLERELETRLLGYQPPRTSRASAEFHVPVPLEEELLLALGRTREPAAALALSSFLENRRSRLRSIACLALGLTGEARAATELGPFLVDPEPFTRWCAYLAIAHLTGIEAPIDWMYAPEEERYAAAQGVWKRLAGAR